MKRRKVISYMNLPTRFPITSTMTQFLLLKYLNVPDTIWGIWITLSIIWHLLCLVAFWTEKTTDIMEDKDATKSN